MSEEILKDYGWCKIIHNNQGYLIYFDEGELVIKMKSYQITINEAKKAIKSETNAEILAREILKRNK